MSDAMTIREEVDKIARVVFAKGERLTAELLIEYAKNDKIYPSLHKRLWGTSEHELANEARLARAHQLIILVRMPVGEEGLRTRQYVHVRGIKGYQDAHHVARTQDLAALKLQGLQARISSARKELRAFRELLSDDVGDAIEQGLVHIESLLVREIAERAERASENGENAA